jgi:hypothetical protein
MEESFARAMSAANRVERSDSGLSEAKPPEL